MASGFTNWDDMSTLQKVVFTGAALDNPSVAMDYLDNQNKTQALQQLAPQLAGMKPADAFTALAKVDPTYLPNLVNYQAQQSDPLRQTELAEAKARLAALNTNSANNAAAQNTANGRAQAVAKLFADQAGGGQPGATQAAPQNPLAALAPPAAPGQGVDPNIMKMFDPNAAPAQQPTAQAPQAAPQQPQAGAQQPGMDFLGKLAAADPDTYGKAYAELLAKQQENSGFKLPEGAKVPNGYTPLPDPTSPTGFKVVPIPGFDKTENFQHAQLEPAAFANRMENAQQLLSQAQASDPTAADAMTGRAGTVATALSAIPSFGLTDKIGQGIVKEAASPGQQQYLNAADEWIRAKLRKESGAAIGVEEAKSEYQQYFPMPGDTDAVKTQKSELRDKVTQGMKKESGGAYDALFGAGSSKNGKTTMNFDAQGNLVQ